MNKKHFSRSIAIAALVLLLAWSTVMTALGHVEAVTTLIPSLALVLQQIVQIVNGGQTVRPASGPDTSGAAPVSNGLGEER